MNPNASQQRGGPDGPLEREVTGRRRTFGWLAFVVAAFTIGNAVGRSRSIDKKDAGVGESAKANKIVDAAFDLDKTGQGEFVVIQSNDKDG